MRRRTRTVIAAGLVGTLIAAFFVFGLESAANPDCCPGKHPYVLLYDHPRSQIEAFLVTGDAQAFAALAQDPLLARPQVITAAGEYAYRAQRPLWGYLTWAVSLGRPDATGWALVALAILACGAACIVTGLLLDERGASPWWSLVVIAAGLETLSELTPELLAFALLAAGVLAWEREKRRSAIALLCLAVLARESMLVGVAALALWELVHTHDGWPPRVRATFPFAWPFAAYAAWATLLRVRLGSWPTGRADTRLAPFGSGLLASVRGTVPTGLAVGVLVGAALCASAVVLARHDRLTWITLAFAVFATTFSREVWLHAGFSRSLIPLYVCGTIATVGGWRARRAGVAAAESADAQPSRAAGAELVSTP
jgi:hypothetical protein